MKISISLNKFAIGCFKSQSSTGEGNASSSADNDAGVLEHLDDIYSLRREVTSL